MSEPQPFDEEPCEEINFPCPEEETSCVWEGWSEWTQCDKFCDGVQFRRQLCSCPDDTETCSDSYSDSLCVGAPLVETRSCNFETENGDLCSNSWEYLDEWSPCVSDNHYCGEGTQWRRQFCLDAEGIVNPDDYCLFSGEVPLFETRECTMNQSCCEFGKLIYMECDSLE